MTHPESPSAGAGLDNGPRAADDRRMEDRLAHIEADLATVKADVASIRANGATKEDLATVKADVASIRSNYATKEDLAKLEVRLFQALNAQTWRLVSWLTGVMAMLTGAVYFVARNVH